MCLPYILGTRRGSGEIYCWGKTCKIQMRGKELGKGKKIKVLDKRT